MKSVQLGRLYDEPDIFATGLLYDEVGEVLTCFA